MIYAIDDMPYGARLCRLTGDHMTGGAVDNHQRARVLECVFLDGVYYPVEHPGWIDTDAPMVPDCGVLLFSGSDNKGFRPASPWHDTYAATDWRATADSRETSPEVMAAIAFLARNEAEAEALWNGDGFGVVCHASDLWEAATKNGTIDAETLYWGGRRFDQAVQEA